MELLIPLFQTNILIAGGMIGGLGINNVVLKEPTKIVGLVNKLIFYG